MSSLLNVSEVFHIFVRSGLLTAKCVSPVLHRPPLPLL